ncbi:MAG: ABC transporter permease [Gammaproteobacteria bacterium]|nr:ABC transporter permease [Gammaproteobacteria bacterium]
MSDIGTYSFKRAQVELDREELSRPSLSYWQDAWMRIRTNRRTLASLIVVVAMVVIAAVGPSIWRFEYDTQDLNQTSKPPWASRTMTVVEPYSPWLDRPEVTAWSSTSTPADIQVVGLPSIEYVRLTWLPVRSAVKYFVFRTIVDPEDGPLGLPLGTLVGASSNTYEDRIDLEARTYWYSVAATLTDGTTTATTTAIEVRAATTLAQAIESKWVEPDSDLQPGETLKTPWHPFGTDYLGRDMLARLMKGAQISLFIGIVAPLLFILLGVVYGSFAGFIGGKVDALLMRFADFVVALPFLLFMILFKLVFGIGAGESGILPMLVALVLLSWPAAARLVRGQILQIREEGYIDASRLLGTKTPRLILRHMIPNTMGVILVSFTFAVPSTIFTEAFLSFIGMGVEPPIPSWGSMCNDGRKTMETTPHELIFPAIFISITVLAFNILGDGLRDALDARMRSTE